LALLDPWVLIRSPIIRGRGSWLRSTAFRAELILGGKVTLY
jgi:hypothetical protein